MKRVSESRLLSSLTLALALGGCGDAASVEEPTIAHQPSGLALPVDQSARWPSVGGSYPVALCWATDGYPREKRIIEGAVDRTWGFFSGVATTWRASCPTTGTEVFVRVQIASRATVDHGATGQTRGLGTRTRSLPSEPNPNGVTFWVEDNEASDQARIENVAVHEFGHVLGLYDAPTRPLSSMNPAIVDRGELFQDDVDTMRMFYPAPARATQRSLLYRNLSTSEMTMVGFFDGMKAQQMAKRYVVDQEQKLVATLPGGTTVWRNRTTGAMSVWFIASNGLTVNTDTGSLPPVSFNWKAAGTGDFDGDGSVDLLWQDRYNGAVMIWKMNGASLSQQTYPQLGVPAAWAIAGTGDFDGDGKADILWRNTANGDVGIWKMNGGTIDAYLYPQLGVPLEWAVEGTGDFDGDGVADILWRKTTTGEIGVWKMNGGAIGAYQYPPRGVPAGFTIAGALDLDGDGKSDILWRNPATGEISIRRVADAAEISGYQYPQRSPVDSQELLGIM